ncbi:MAG: phosphoribosylglycinamide formyltransferase, partial [Pseudomonadota bacterium]|nr:phosphoribosylglycinamide formyltransferase [Pseudomonadota bacterium]
IGPTVVNAYPNKILNIHPALLPKYPGLNTHKRALDNRDEEHGVSIHIVTHELDAGPIIAQQAFPIDDTDTPDSLEQKAHEIEHQLYPETLAKIARGQINLNH